MQTEYYKDSLKGALKNLIKVNESIYDSLIPIAMTGELSEWSKSVPIGERHQFNFELFKNCDDTNIRLLVKLIDTVDEIFETIKNINGIKMGEE